MLQMTSGGRPHVLAVLHSLRAPVAVLTLFAVLAVVSGCGDRSDRGTADGGAADGSEPSATADDETPGQSLPTTSAPGNTVVTATTSGTAAPLAPAVDAVGSVTHGTLEYAGRERTFRLYVPRTLPSGPAPLFVGLHGGTGWGDQFATTNHIEGLAESNGFIVVHPDGVQLAAGPGGVWNGGVCCGVAAREDVDDVGFVSALLDHLVAEHHIDSTRTFAFGHSNGGIMSYRLACELSDRIAGIGVVAGTLGVEGCAPTRPVSVIHIHGTADQNLPIDGGVGADSLSQVDFPPPQDGFATLATAIGCPVPSEDTAGDVTTALRQPCDGGAAAAFVTIETAGHAWPGGTPRLTPTTGAGYPTYDATAEIATFLLAHPRS